MDQFERNGRKWVYDSESDVYRAEGEPEHWIVKYMWIVCVVVLCSISWYLR